MCQTKFAACGAVSLVLSAALGSGCTGNESRFVKWEPRERAIERTSNGPAQDESVVSLGSFKLVYPNHVGKQVERALHAYNQAVKSIGAERLEKEVEFPATPLPLEVAVEFVRGQLMLNLVIHPEIEHESRLTGSVRLDTGPVFGGEALLLLSLIANAQLHLYATEPVPHLMLEPQQTTKLEMKGR